MAANMVALIQFCVLCKCNKEIGRLDKENLETGERQYCTVLKLASFQ